MNSPSYPAPPDPAATAAAQTTSNKDTAVANANLNRIDQYTPQGSTRYNVIGTNPDGTPKYEQISDYSPWEKEIYNKNIIARQNVGGIAADQSARIGGMLSTPFNFDMPEMNTERFSPNIGKLPTDRLSLNTNFDINDATEGKINDLSRRRLDPLWDQNYESKKTELFNSGVTPGTAAYDRAMGQFNQAKNDAYSSMFLSGRGQAANEALSQFNANNSAATTQFTANSAADLARQQQEYQQDLGIYNTNQTTDLNNRNQQMREQLAVRNQPINEISALMSGSQVSNPAAPNVPQAGMANTDVAGIYNNNFNQQMQVANAQNSSQNAMMGGLFGLGGAAMRFLPW